MPSNEAVALEKAKQSLKRAKEGGHKDDSPTVKALQAEVDAAELKVSGGGWGVLS